jgi:hypothetical protein
LEPAKAICIFLPVEAKDMGGCDGSLFAALAFGNSVAYIVADLDFRRPALTAPPSFSAPH